MASRASVLLVFVIPAVASIALSGVVMAQILQEPGRSGGVDSEHVAIVGLEDSYAAPAALNVHVHVTHSAFDCGDLDIKVLERDTREIISTGGFFGQCFASTNTMIPVGDAFTASIAEAGTYEIIATIEDAQKRNKASATEVFTVN